MYVDVKEMKAFIEDSGIKQKVIASKAGLEEYKLCMSLLGKRKFEAGEYADVCKALNVSMTKFIKNGMAEGEPLAAGGEERCL